MSANCVRIGERTFFIYDHSVTKKEEDDPKDAIIYFFPQHTSIDIQCIFCNQLMGMVNCTKTLAGSPPKLYKLRRNKIATIHEGNFTLALACKLRTPDSTIVRKLENLYRVFAFYHCSITTVQQISSNNEAFLSSMASIWDFYVPYVRRYGNTVPAMFEPIQSVKLLKGGNFLFLRCSHLLQWLKGQPSLLAGCILHKTSVLCTQLTPELTSHLLLIKPNQLHHPSKSVTDTVLPFGVRIMSVYVTEQQYKQLCKPLQPLTKAYQSVEAKQPDAFIHKPPTSPPSTSTESASRRTLEKRISTTTGKLFSNFTGMLEGTVVESLWPSASKSGTACSRSESPMGYGKRESLMDEPPGSMKDRCSDEVMLSRSSDDVVRALQGDEGSPGRDSSGITHCDDQTPTRSKDTDDGPDYSPRHLNYHNSSIAWQSSHGSYTNETSVALSGAQHMTNSLAALGTHSEVDLGFAETNLPNNTVYSDDKLKSLIKDTKCTDSVLPVEMQKDERFEQKREREVNETGAVVTDSTSDCDQRVDLIFQSGEPLGQMGKAQKACSVLSEQKRESPESGIGDCAVQRRNEDFNSIDQSLRGKDNEFEEVVENGPIRRYNAVEVISVGARPLADSKDGLSHDSTLCKDGRSEKNTVLLTEGDATSSINATCVDCLCNPNPNAVLMNGSAITKDDSSVLKSRDSENIDATEMNPRRNSVYKDKEMDISVETNLSHLSEVSVMSSMIEETSEAHNKDWNLASEDLIVSELKPDILKSSEDEQRENSDLLELPKMNNLIATDSRNGDSTEDVNSNIKYDESENLLTKLCSASEIEDVVSKAREKESPEEVRLSKTEKGKDRNSDEGERTILEEGKDVGVISGQGLQDTEGRLREEGTGTSDTVETAGKLYHNINSEVQVLHNIESGRRDTFHDNLTSVEEPHDVINVHSSDERPDSEEGFLSKDELYEGRQEATGEISEDDKASKRPTLEINSSTIDQDTETMPGLVNVSLYVQAHSDTTLLFLAEKSIMKEKETLLQLWQSALRELGEVELQLKSVVRPDREMDCKSAYNFIHFDNHDRSLEGSITNPVNQAESFFCRGCQLTHEQFLRDETLTDVTLRNHQTVVYAHQSACHHTFFHNSYKSNPSPGIPSRDDAGFYIQNSCKEVIKEHSINLL